MLFIKIQLSNPIRPILNQKPPPTPSKIKPQNLFSLPLNLGGNGVLYWDRKEDLSKSNQMLIFRFMLSQRRNGESTVPAGGEGSYRFGFNGQEKDDEVKGIGNQISFVGYGYDPRLGRRLGTDPIIFAGQSSYCVFNNNPILFIDPTGKGAEVSAKRDEKGKVTSIEVTAKIFVHGKNAESAVESIKADIEKNLKGNLEFKGVWGGSKKVPVNFNISVESVDDDGLAAAKESKETDQSINIVEMNETESRYNGEGFFVLSLETQLNRGNTFSHEFFHMMGFNSNERPDPTHFSDAKEGMPHPLMYDGTANDEVLKQRVITAKDIAGLRNRQGLYFHISPKRRSASLIIEYFDPAGPHPYSNGEKTKQ